MRPDSEPLSARYLTPSMLPSQTQLDQTPQRTTGSQAWPMNFSGGGAASGGGAFVLEGSGCVDGSGDANSTGCERVHAPITSSSNAFTV